MKTFNDSKGREWKVDLTVGCMRRIRASLEVDLTAPEEAVDEDGKPDPTKPTTLAQRMVNSLMLFVDVLFAALAPQAKELDVDVHAFCEALPPTHCHTARDVFLSEWEEFFQQLGRTDQAAVVRGAKELEAELRTSRETATTRLQAEAIPEIRSQVEAETTRMIAELKSGTLLTNSPESSASTQNP